MTGVHTCAHDAGVQESQKPRASIHSCAYAHVTTIRAQPHSAQPLVITTHALILSGRRPRSSTSTSGAAAAAPRRLIAASVPGCDAASPSFSPQLKVLKQTHRLQPSRHSDSGVLLLESPLARGARKLLGLDPAPVTQAQQLSQQSQQQQGGMLGMSPLAAGLSASPLSRLGACASGPLPRLSDSGAGLVRQGSGRMVLPSLGKSLCMVAVGVRHGSVASGARLVRVCRRDCRTAGPGMCA